MLTMQTVHSETLRTLTQKTNSNEAPNPKFVTTAALNTHVQTRTNLDSIDVYFNKQAPWS